MARSDFVPARDAEFDGWLANLAVYVEARTTGAAAWTHIPAAKVTELKQRVAEWRTAYARTTGPHTSVDTEAKNDARKAADTIARQFVAQYLKYDPVTNEDRTAMNLHNRDTTHSPINRPTTRALITEIRALGGFRVEIRFQDETTPNSHAIPYGCNGAVLYYTWGPNKETAYDALTKSCLRTRSPFVLELPPEAEGQYLTVACRWQSERGELGPWGEITHIAIS